MNRRDFLITVPALAALPAASAPAIDGKARMRSAICAYSFRDALKAKTMTYDDLVRLAVGLNVDGLDLTVYWFPDTSDAFLLPLRRLAYKSAVEIYSISIRSDMCQPTEEKRSNELAELKKWVDVAQRLGAGHIRVFGGKVPKDATEDQAAGWVTEILKQGGEYAGKQGIILGLENHGGITSRAERILQIVKQVDSPWVGINVDTGNFERDAYAQVATLLPYAANVQLKVEVKDKNGVKEPSDWNRFIKMFASSGYKGYVALEYEDKSDPAVAVPLLIRKLKRILRTVA